jgi:hypothetical protein
MKTKINSTRQVGLPIGLWVSVLFGFGLTACTEKIPTPQLPGVPPLSSSPAVVPTTQVLGVIPAEPKREKAATTPGTKTDMTKSQESRDMPMPGQANDHSVEKPKSPQSPASR